MKNIFLLILFGIFSFTAFGQTVSATYEPATLILKNGTTREVILEVVKTIDMQFGIRCFDPKLLTPGRTAASVPKENFAPSDVKEIRLKKRSFETWKYADLTASALSAFGKNYIIEVGKSGKLKLYNFYNGKGKLDPLIGKQGEEKLRPVAATSLMKYIEDAAPIKEKFKNGGYGNNPKNDNAILNDNLKFIHALVDEYNEFAAYGRILTPEEKASRKKFSEMIIFDLFMNYELSQRNGNNAVILDYLPNRDKKDLKRVVMKSNYGHENEVTDFQYNANSDLVKINYQRGDKLFVYDFNYVNGALASIHIGGKKRIEFLYSNDTLKSVVREMNEMSAEYDLTYEKEQQKTWIVLTVVDKGKRQKSSSKYYLTWNAEKKITDFNFDVYVSKGITYTASGDIASFSATTSHDSATINWEYTTDEKNNWTERKFKTFLVTRQIEYLAR
jgi:hypothetical protein